MNVDFFPSRPRFPTQSLTTLGFLLNNRSPGLLRAGFAYVTVGGVDELIGSLENSPIWPEVRKQFIAGINQGITEPHALSRLMSLPNSEVRLFLPGKKLTPVALYDTPTFHGKVLACNLAGNQDPVLIIASSANLTTAAVGSRPRNFEFGLGVVSNEGEPSLDAQNVFNPWWDEAWKLSRK